MEPYLGSPYSKTDKCKQSKKQVIQPNKLSLFPTNKILKVRLDSSQIPRER